MFIEKSNNKSFLRNYFVCESIISASNGTKNSDVTGKKFNGKIFRIKLYYIYKKKRNVLRCEASLFI